MARKKIILPYWVANEDKVNDKELFQKEFEDLSKGEFVLNLIENNVTISTLDVSGNTNVFESKNIIDEKINNEHNRITLVEEEINNKIDVIKTELDETDVKLLDDINKLDSKTEALFSGLTQALNEEHETRIDHDNMLLETLQKEIERAIDKDNSIELLINDEIERASNEEKKLNNILELEKEKRISGDTTLTTLISVESEQRLSGDTILQTQINENKLLFEKECENILNLVSSAETQINMLIENTSSALTAYIDSENKAQEIELYNYVDEKDLENYTNISKFIENEIDKVDEKLNNINSSLTVEINSIKDINSEKRLVDLEGKSHEHDNKTILDSINEEKINSWDNSLNEAKSYVDEKLIEVSNSYDIKGSSISALTEAKIYIDEQIDNLSYDAKGSSMSALTEAKLYADSLSKNYEPAGAINSYDIEIKSWVENKGYLTSHQDISHLASKAVVDTLVGQDENKSARSIAQDEASMAIAKVVASADTSFDTLKEIADWIKTDETNSTQIVNDIANLKNIAHTHSNKTIIDNITQNNIDSWNNSLNDAKSYIDEQIDGLSYDTKGSAATAENNAKSYTNESIAEVRTWVENKGYLTTHQDISHLASTEWVKANYVPITGDTTVEGTLLANDFCTTSDARLKDFVGNVEIDFEKLKLIPKKYYYWKDKTMGKQLQIGTSAQDLKKVYPTCVFYDEISDKYTVNYPKLSIIALAAIDKLYEENKELKYLLNKIIDKLNL